ncbi:MAG: M15 family metallopeptidase [Candidatus Woesearchaeota archaeon]
MNKYSKEISGDRIFTEKDLENMMIIDCGERLFDIDRFVKAKILMSQARREYQGEDKLYARKTVCNMLSEASKRLPSNYSFAIFDAHRPVEYQQKRFESLYKKIRDDNPGLNEDEVRAKTFIYIFPPSMDLKTPPPHSTGGAIDLSIIDDKGELLDMGTAYGEFGERTYTYSSKISPVQKRNRQKLINIMTSAGFANYPGEWWHFMYGDREWAAYTGKPYAIYTRISANDIEKL